MPSARDSLKEFLLFLYYIPYFFYWWYVKRLIFAIRFLWRTLLLIIDGLSLLPMVRFLFAPYHQDRTFVGRLIGFIVRSLWILVSIVVTAFSLVILLTIIPLHLMWPFGFYFGMAFATYFDLPWQQVSVVLAGWSVTLSAILVYGNNFVIQPKKTIKDIDLSQKINFMQLENIFTPRLRRDWEKAFRLASVDDDLEDLSYYLFLAAITNKRNRPIFYRLSLSPQSVFQKAKEKEFDLKKSFIPLTELFQKMLETATKLGHKHLDSDVLLVTLVDNNKAIHDLFVDFGISNEEIEYTSQWIYAKIKSRNAWKYWEKDDFRLRGGYDRAWTSGWTPTLKHFSQDITRLVAEGRVPYLIGRRNEIEQVVRILTRTTKNNVILLGPAGVGKTSIVYSIAQQMIRGELSEIKGKKLVALDFAALVADSGARGQFESRMKKILNESGPGQTILFIDEMASTMYAGGSEGSVNAASVLSPYLSSGDVQMIGAVSFADYRKIIEPNESFASYFQTVEIKEPEEKEVMTILESVSSSIEAHQKVTISFQAIEAAVKLSKQYIRDRVLPEKAIDILDEAAVAVKRSKRLIVREDDIAHVISSKTGIPVSKVSQPEKDKLLDLERELHERIIGQDEAVKVISDAMRRARVGLKDEQKPVARFLFLGPTGVGKTETCKALADMYYGSEKNIIRLDMSEYQNADSINRLLGAAPGTKDFEAGGQLTEAIRRRPFSLILLDELEKAHPRILDIFLQVLDDGRLTDSSGRTISFQDSIIIATSNAQAIVIQEAVRKGQRKDELKALVLQNLNQTFRPEFINRFDSVVVFDPLAMEQVLQIAVLMLQGVRDNLEEKEIGFEITPEALLKIAQLGFNPEFGARPLKRVIQDKIENNIAEKILRNEVKPGDVIKIDEQDIV